MQVAWMYADQDARYREGARANTSTHGSTSTLDTWVIALHIGGACSEAGHVR